LQISYDDWWTLDHASEENTKMKLVNSSKVQCSRSPICR
jgi:hypothetical protein